MYPSSYVRSLLIQDEEDISTELMTYVDEHMNMTLVEMAYMLYAIKWIKSTSGLKWISIACHLVN